MLFASAAAAALLFFFTGSASFFLPASAAAGADSPPPPPGPNSGPSPAPSSSCTVSEWPPFSSLPASSSEGGPRTTLNLELLLTGPSLCPFCAKPQAAVVSVVSNTVQTVPHAIEVRSVGQVAVKLAPGATAAPPAVTLADLALIDVPVEVPRGGGSAAKNGGGGKKPSGRRRRRQRRLQSLAPSELLQLPAALDATSGPNRQRRALFAAGPPPPAPASPAPAPSSSSSVAPGCDVPSGYVYTVSGAQHVTVNLTLTLAAASVTLASQMLQSAADGGAMISGFAQSGLSVEKVQILLLRDLAAGGAAADVMLGTPVVQMPQLPAPLAPLANATATGGARPGEVGVQPGAIAGILAAAVAGTATAVAVVYKLSTGKRRRRGKQGGGRGANGVSSGASDLDDDELDIEAVKAGIGLPPSMGKPGNNTSGGNNAMQQSSNSLLDRDPALRLLNSRAAAAAAAAAAANGGSDGDSALLHGASTDDSAVALRGGMGASGSLSDFGGANQNSSSTALASADGRAGSGAMHALWQVNWRDLEIVRQIGEGSFGKVYLAKWRETTVAVKVLLSASLPNEQEDGGVGGGNGGRDGGSGDGGSGGENPLLAGLQKEASMMAAMRHPNVVMYLGVCADPPLVVTEYCARGSLCDVLKRARSAAINAAAAASPGGNGCNVAAAAAAAAAAALDWPRRLAMALDAAKGMNYLHSSDPPVIHRDLKSPNLLVDKHWRVKVCDFNLSRVLEEQAVVSSLAASNPRWLAPEILSGRGYTFSSDVYSFGVILWELLTWRLPWTDCGPWQVVKLVTDDRARPPLPTLDADGNAIGTTPPPQVPNQQQASNSSSSAGNGHQLLPPPGGFPGLPEYIALIKDCWRHEAEERPKFAEIITRLRRLLLHETRRAAAAARRGGSGGSDDGATAAAGGGGTGNNGSGGGGGGSSANLSAAAAAAAGE